MKLHISKLYTQKLFIYSLLILQPFVIILLSYNQLKYSTEVHHWGLMVDNAKDYLNGANLYKDIFVAYGPLTIIIHSLSLYLWYNVQSVFLITILFYSVTPFLIYRIILYVSNNIYSALMGSLICFCFAPIVIYPWPNYIAEPFILLGLHSYINKNNSINSKFILNFNGIISGIYLGIATLIRQDLLVAITFFFILVFFNYLIKNDKNKERYFVNILKSKLASTIITYYTIILLLFAFIISKTSISDLYIYYIEFPKAVYPHFFPTQTHLGYFGFLYNLIRESYRGLVMANIRWILTIGILLSNIFYIAYYIISINNQYVNFKRMIISSLSIALFLTTIHISELYRIATGPLIGIINFIPTETTSRRDYLPICFISLLMLFSINEYTFGGNYFSAKTDLSNTVLVTEPKIFMGLHWSNDKINYYKHIDFILNDIKLKYPKIKYIQNESLDNFIPLLSHYKYTSLFCFDASQMFKYKNYRLFKNKTLLSDILQSKEHLIVYALKKGDTLNLNNTGYTLYERLHSIYFDFVEPDTDIVFLVPK